MAASLETKFKKLPPQSQTPEAAENLADKLLQFDLTENDIVYLDLLSNQVYLGTDEEGNSTDPYNDSQNRWHITGSLVAAAKPRLRRVLERLAAINEACGKVKTGITWTTSRKTRSGTSTRLLRSTVRPACWQPSLGALC